MPLNHGSCKAELPGSNLGECAGVVGDVLSEFREWFAEEMGNLGVAERYRDAFCGRAPKSVLAKHYTDYAPGKLKKIYEKVKLKVLN